MAFIATWAQNKAAEYLKTGIQAGGTLAGNTVGGVGSLIESSGKSLGEGTINGSVRGVGTFINSYGDSIRGVTAADSPVRMAKKTSIQPSMPKTAPTQKPMLSKAQTTLPTESRRGISAPKTPTRPQKSDTSRQATISKPEPHGRTGRKAKLAPGSASKPKTTKTLPTTSAKASKSPMPQMHGSSSPARGGKKRISASSQPKASQKV